MNEQLQLSISFDTKNSDELESNNSDCQTKSTLLLNWKGYIYDKGKENSWIYVERFEIVIKLKDAYSSSSPLQSYIYFL